MNKKQKAKIRKSVIGTVIGAVIGVLFVGVLVVGAQGGSFWDKVAQYAGLGIADKITFPDNSDETLGAVPTPDVYNKMYFHDGFIAKSGIHIDLQQIATTTAANPAAAGYWCNNTNQKLLVNSNWHLDIETANGLWGSNWTVGTTTKSGDNSLTSTSTATLMPSTAIAASATGFYDRDTRTVLGTYYDGGGNATTTPFLLDKNVCLVVYSDHGGATSSDSYLSSGGFTTFVGGFHADVEIR